MAQAPAGYRILPTAVDSKRTTWLAGRYERVPPVREFSAHVGQPAPSPHEGFGAAAGSRPERIERTLRNHHFATALRARARDDRKNEDAVTACTEPWPAGPAPRGAHWLPVDGPTPRRALPVEAHHRLVVGSSAGQDSARLRIEGGRFAGTEIHFVLAGSRLEVHVLTPHEASRQTLAIAMEAARNRLRARGLAMVEAPAPATRRLPPRAQAWEDEGGQGNGHGRPSI